MIIENIERHANQQPDEIAIISGNVELTYQALWVRINDAADWLSAQNIRCLAISLSNCIEWAILDLAAIKIGLTTVPIPDYFTPKQVQSLIKVAAVDCLITGEKPTAAAPFEFQRFKPDRAPKTRSKITFTSGSTGTPNGVVLSHDSLAEVATSIVAAMEQIQVQRHLCILPLATLLENIAGLYAPLIKGIQIILPTPEESGLTGSSNLDIGKMASCISTYKPHSIIVVPQLLMAITTLSEMGLLDHSSFKMIAVGGGKVAKHLIDKSAEMGLPVFEGYGLSEAGSVTTLNLPGKMKSGTVGRVMPHAQVRVNEKGELEVKGTLMTGYIGQPEYLNEWLPTGDLASIDEEGFVTIHGRIKNMFITSFGRNVNPEWVEASLTQDPAIQHALVFGEGQATNLALIWPRFEATRDELEKIISAANRALPDYAKISDFIVMKEDIAPSLVTPNGRLKQQSAIDHHDQIIRGHYDSIGGSSGDSSGESTDTNRNTALTTAPNSTPTSKQTKGLGDTL